MKVLLDTCISRRVVKELTDAGHDVIWSGDWLEDPGDEEILKRAYSEQRILVTLDKDFGEMAVFYNQRHCGILRIAAIATANQGSLCRHILTRYGDELLSGAIITAEPGRLRIRPPDIE